MPIPNTPLMLQMWRRATLASRVFKLPQSFPDPHSTNSTMSTQPITIEEVYSLQEKHMAMFAEIVQDYCKNRDRILQLEQECEQLKSERDQYKSKCEAYAHEQWEAERAKAGRM